MLSHAGNCIGIIGNQQSCQLNSVPKECDIPGCIGTIYCGGSGNEKGSFLTIIAQKHVLATTNTIRPHLTSHSAKTFPLVTHDPKQAGCRAGGAKDV